ncbi:hypothetical protein J3B02_001143 [Coemansia erecta]|nr:hypothetical protein J3B02_001143 [Coemansia erecta]
MEFIDTPARAPSASKRIMMRSESPTRFDESDAHRMLLAETETLSIHSVDSPPVRFSIGNGQNSLSLSSSSASSSAAPLVKHNLGFGAAANSGSLLYADMNNNNGASAARDKEINNCEPAGDLVAANQQADLGLAAESVANTEGGNSTALDGSSGFRVDRTGNDSNNEKKKTGANDDNDNSDEDDDDSEIEFSVRKEPQQTFGTSFIDHSNPIQQQQQQSTTSPFSLPVSIITSTSPPTKQSSQATSSDNMTPAVSRSALQHISPDDSRMVDDCEEDMMVTDTPVKSKDEQEQGQAAKPKTQATTSDLISFETKAMEAQEKPDLTSARILSDPDLLHAASVPLPATPAMNGNQLTPPRKKSPNPTRFSAPGSSGSSDFLIPTDWLMSPDPKKKQDESSAVSTPPLKSGTSAGGNLVSMTPVNQKLLDSLEIQWVSPRRVPKYSEVDMEEARRGYEEKLAQRDELHRMIMESVKEEFAAKMREVEKKAEQEIRKAFDAHKQQMERLVLEHGETLKAERRKHTEDISRRDEDTRIQVAELNREVEQGIAERASIVEQRDKYQMDLEQLVSLSAQMEQEKDSHIHGLEQELGNMAVERQRLTQQLNEALSTAEDLNSELDGAVKRVEDLTTENIRLDQENSTLHSDIGVAEQRNVAIKEHAEKMLATANSEIANIHDQLNSARHEIQALKTQVSRAESRSKSLQIQLDSAKRQNEELLALCERIIMRASVISALVMFSVSVLGAPQIFGNGLVYDPFTGSGSFFGAAGSVDSAGNSVLRIDQDTRVHGQNIAGLNQNSVSGQQSGPAIEANGAVVVVEN